VGMIAMSSLKVSSALIKIRAGKNYADFLKGILDTVSKSDQVRVKVLEEKPDEIADQKPKQGSLSMGSLEEFKDEIKTTSDCFFDVLALSEILLKTKLPKNVLSFKELNNVLTKVKIASKGLSENKEHCDLIVERIGTNVGRILIARKNNLNNSTVRKTVHGSVDYVIADFMALKKIMATLVTTHYPLYDVNPMFKKYTDYPATWFFDPSVFYNFSERYKDASDNLINLVRAEASVIKPLYGFQSTYPLRVRPGEN
ncbi:MAG: hypothetical protein IMZ64_04295, partial [Bacteroidetes bacterium]|nr:hypothetical protein [Bacteroidota bacterium]